MSEPIKLYEFTYTVPDADSMSATEREVRVAEFLMGEAELQGWVQGYDWQLVNNTVDSARQCTVYQYQVTGEYLD